MSEARDKARDAAERVMFSQDENTDDAITVAEFIMRDPEVITSGGMGIDSDGTITLNLNGNRVILANDVAQAILRGLLKQATVTL